MFDIGTGELLALAVLALLVLGPEKLPRYAAEAARFLRQVRSLASDARAEVRRELGPELDGLDLREINPRALLRKHVLEGLDDDEPVSRPPRPRPNGSSPRAQSRTTQSAPAPYDPDTT